MRKYKLLLILHFITWSIFAQEQYVVKLNDIKAPVQPTMWGLFFEDINRSGDGGVYADLVKNRSFDFPEAMMGWSTIPSRRQWGKADMFRIVHRATTNPNNPKYLQVIVDSTQTYSLINESFGGLSLKKGLNYTLIIHYRLEKGPIKIKATCISGAGKSVAAGINTLHPTSNNEWTTIQQTLTTTDTTHNGKLVLTIEGKGTIDIDRISLFPTDTWKGRAEGLRNDLVQKLYDLKPGFLRFPGGCIVEGKTIDTRYQWKTTIGPINQRKLIANQWQEGAAGKALPDYYQSFGLGFYEYFQLCEDVGAAPLPIINCGLSCQFDAAEMVPVDQLDPYIQDALDLVEFANGDVNSTWGAKRAALGHAAPFNLVYLGVGNENWGPQYIERLDLFTKAIKQKYPYIQIITSTGYSPNAQFKYMDSALRANKVDIIDEHYYQTPQWFLQNAGKYDTYDRKGPKIFIGEFACASVRIGSPENKNTQLCALAEAAFMTGLERNADIVTMAAYAPLFAHVKDWQWTPNLIWFDNNASYATPSYYVQQLFSINKGTDVVSITRDNKVITGQDSLWASAVIDKKTNEVIIKIVNPSSKTTQKTVTLQDLKKSSTTGTVTVLKGHADDVNSIENTTLVAPATAPIQVKNKKLNVAITPYSFTVVRIRL